VSGGRTEGRIVIPPERSAETFLHQVDPAARDAMADARTRFLTRNAFLGVVTLGLPLTENLTVRSLTSDGRALYYNPYFVRDSPRPLVEAHLFHTVLHWALGHAWRGAGRDPRKWQRAADLSLVPLFLRSGYDYRGVLPLQAPPEIARGRSAEEIYAVLPEPDEPTTDARSPTAEVAECWQEPLGGAGHDRQLRDRWRERLVQAAQSMEYVGGATDFSEEVLQSLDAPRLDWRARLTLFLRRSYAQDFAWIPPNRRYLSRGFLLPGSRGRSFGDLVLAVDTSGSIDPAVAERFLTEVRTIGQLVGTSGRPILIQADDAVRDVRVLEPGLPVPLAIRGRGGTDFRPVFEYLQRATAVTPSGLIYLTDGNGPFPDAAPPFPVLWVMPVSAAVPWGDLLVLPDG
jgi:predicted metal-dependent peptidase